MDRSKSPAPRWALQPDGTRSPAPPATFRWSYEQWLCLPMTRNQSAGASAVSSLSPAPADAVDIPSRIDAAHAQRLHQWPPSQLLRPGGHTLRFTLRARVRGCGRQLGKQPRGFLFGQNHWWRILQGTVI